MSALAEANPTPNLWSLRRSDVIIERAMNVTVFMLFASVGMLWASQPVSPVPPPDGPVFEVWIGKYISAGALVVAVIAALVLLRRYRLVTKILRHGETVRGIVDNLENYTYTNRDSSTGSTSSRRYYWATLRYPWDGAERTVTVKLPNSGFTYGLVKGHETDLIVLRSLPHKPLIRSVYLGRRG